MDKHDELTRLAERVSTMAAVPGHIAERDYIAERLHTLAQGAKTGGVEGDWRAAFVQERARYHRSQGAKIEQAHILAETDAHIALTAALAPQPKDAR
ncbi:MAG: hypothetical protein V4636_19930 [Pseudomonadota bacterium]